MTTNLEMDKFILVLLIDVFICLFVAMYVLHKFKIETTATQDKLVMCLLGTLAIKITQYIGLIWDVQNDIFSLSLYLGDFGIALTAFLTMLIMAEMIKVHRRGII